MRDGNMLKTEDPSTEHAGLDEYPTTALVNALVDDQRNAAVAVRAAGAQIAAAVDAAVPRIEAGGRLIYVGAGTSGRLGLLDSVELNPTFSWPRDRAVALIAGGTRAIFEAIEGAEDDEAQGANDLHATAAGTNDVVIAIAASGTTPYVRAALERAASLGAKTGIVACSPPPPDLVAKVDVTVLPIVGPEVVTGSTRMKAGTATKLVLNTITTGAMIRLGKTYGNLMVDLRATNNKLTDRSQRIVMEVCGVSRDEAAKLIERAGKSVKLAIVMQKRGVSRGEAEKLLAENGGVVRRVTKDAPPPVREA